MSQDTSMIDPEILQSDQQVSVTREEPTIQRVTPIQQETTSPPLATTLHDYASIDAFERLQSVLNSELQQFLDVHPNYASIDAALNVSIGVSNRLLERLRELDDSSNQPIAADRVENDEMDQDFVSAYPDPSLPTAPQTGVPQPPPRHTHPSSNPFQQFSDASLGGYPREEHDSAAHDHAAQHPLMSHGTIDNGNAQPLNSQVAAGGSGATGFDFDSVLPDAVLAIQYQLPYDSLWLHKLGVPLNKLAEFSEVWRCKQKFEDMCRLGAIAVGDEFAVLCYDATGGQQWRYAKVMKIERSPAPNTGSHWAAHIAMLNSKGGQPVTETRNYGVKPDEVAQAIAQFHGSNTVGNTARAGYSLLFVWRGDQSLGSISDVRTTYALWQATVDNWAGKQGLNWRRRRIDRKTGRFHPDPCIERR